MKRYALIGAAGYVAPRHMAAIKATGGELVAACDISDSVGILDKYFPDCEFFTSPERFERYLDKDRCTLDAVQYLVVCTPNYLHDTHIRMGLHAGLDVICEKPMVIKPYNAEALSLLADEVGKKINIIQQLRLHPAIQDIAEQICIFGKKKQVMVNYVTPRGKWYQRSWKGNREKSGGLAMNIGVHIFDLLISLFGPVVNNKIYNNSSIYCFGKLEFKYVDVDYHLSISSTGKAKRELIIDNQLINFSKGFENLHTKSYEEILAGRGFGPEDILPALELVNNL